MASPTVLMFSASSSGISTSNSSSIAITSSTMSRLSAPRSSMKEDSGLISSSPTPSWSAMMDLTFASMFVVAMYHPSKSNIARTRSGDPRARYIPRRHSFQLRRLHVHPAVDPEHLTGDVGSLIARQKEDRIGDLWRISQPGEWYFFQHLRPRLRRDSSRHVGVNKSRRYRIHANVSRRELAGH